MPEFAEKWAEAKHYKVEALRPFGVVAGQLWVPTYVKERWRIFEVDLDLARTGAGNVFGLIGHRGENIVPLFKAALGRGPRAAG